MNGALENHSVGQVYFLSRWLNVMRSLRKTRQDSTSLAKGSFRASSLDMRFKRGDPGKERLLVADFEVLKK